MNKYTLPRFCRLCHNEMKEDEYDKCDKCKENPLWWVIERYKRVEDDKLRQELWDSDHDCRRPDACSICGRIAEATHEETLQVEQMRKQVLVIRWFRMEGPSLNG